MNRLAPAALALGLLSCASDQRIDGDAVPVYRALEGRFRKLPECITKAFDGEPADPAEVDAAIAPYAPLLADLARATRMSRCDWTPTGAPLLGVDYPLDYVLAAGRLLMVRADLRMERGAAREALDDLLVLSQFGSDLQQDRPLIANLLGMKIVMWACHSVRRWVREARLDRNALEAAEAHFGRAARRSATFETALRNERLAALSLIDEVAEVGLSETLRRITKEEKEEPPSGIVEQWQTWIRDTLRKNPDRARKIIAERWDGHLARLSPYRKGPLNSRPQTFDKDHVAPDVVKRMGTQALGLGREGDDALKDIGNLLFMLWVPAMAKMPRHFAAARLWPELTASACALELHRLETGSYPESFGGEDPFDGEKLKYLRVATSEGEGYVLTSAGPEADHEPRARFLAEECRFNHAQFDERYPAADPYTVGVFRRR